MNDKFPEDQTADEWTLGPFSYQSADGDCEQADVVVASRVQLFRNIAEHSFVGVSSEDQLNDVRRTVTDCLQRSPGLEDLPIIDSQQLREIERQFLMELQSVIDAAAGQGADADGLESGDALFDHQLFPQSLSDSLSDSLTDSLGESLGESIGELASEFQIDRDHREVDSTDLDDASDLPFGGVDADAVGDENRLESLFFDRIADAVSMSDLECDQFGQRDFAANACDRLPSHEMSITVNEEDHLRLQMLAGGYCLNKMWRVVSELDDRLQQTLNYAFSPRWGYLSASPANVGTAMRATVLLHLPALATLGRLDTVFARLKRDGVVGRGAFDDSASGNFYRIGNQVTLGRSESSLINRVTCVVPAIVDYERAARMLLVRQYRDRIVTQSADACRALKLKVRRSKEEWLSLISKVRLGISLGLITSTQAAEVQSNFELTWLKRKLETAVKLEQYASATKYRDRIRQLEQRHYGH